MKFKKQQTELQRKCLEPLSLLKPPHFYWMWWYIAWGQCYNLIHQLPTDYQLVSDFYAPVDLLGKVLYDFFLIILRLQG